jgi:effector-binding domain-containing protein
MSSPASVVPRVVDLPLQPYVFVRHTVSISTMNRVADRLPEVFNHLVERGVTMTDAPFFRYLLIDMPDRLDVEAGVPVASVEGLELPHDLRAGVLPAGRYATFIHRGHPDGLASATTALLGWAEQQGLDWDRERTPEGEAWGARLERYLTDPRVQPDMNLWETELAFRLLG